MAKNDNLTDVFSTDIFINAAEKELVETDSLTAFAIDLKTYMKGIGYQVPDSFLVDFSKFGSAVCNQARTKGATFSDFESLAPVFESLMVKSSLEHETFYSDYFLFLKNRYETASVGKEDANKVAKLNKNKRKDEERLSRLLDSESDLKVLLDELNEKASQMNVSLSKTQLNKLESTGKNVKAKRLYKGLKTEIDLSSIEQYAKGEKPLPDEYIIDQMQEDLKEALKRAVSGTNPIEAMHYIEQLSVSLNQLKKKGADSQRLRDDLRRTQNELNNNWNNQATTQARIDDAVKELNEFFQTTIEKGASIEHRLDFIFPHRAVKSSFFDDEIIFDKKFKSLSEEEKRAIYESILDNARKLKTRISRNIRSKDRHKLDMEETIKYACSTNGIPMRLEYTKPKRDKTKLLMFLDVSGSCKQASEFMLTFMYIMKEIFPGGCETYAFVNTLLDISELFNVAGAKGTENANEVVSNVLSNIPTRGYSNYYEPFKYFYENKISSVTKDSVVFFIGDARNNKNDSGEDYVKAIARKCKKAYWLNTEEAEKWNHADSIMRVYGKYMKAVAEILTPKQLVDFITEVA